MNRLCLSLVVTTLTLFGAVVACSDDPATGEQGAGGDGSEAGGNAAAGDAAGGKASGGSNATSGSAGEATSGGADGAGGEPMASAGAAGESGAMAGAGGEMAGGAGGAGGMGGAGSDLVYECNDTTLTHKLCSALKAADCSPATDCADCVTTYNSDREPFDDCAACSAQLDAFWQCGVDAFESGNLSAGVECVEEYGADLQFENCYPMLDSAISCVEYANGNSCPAVWPLPQ